MSDLNEIKADFNYRNPLKEGEAKPAFGLQEEDPSMPNHKSYKKIIQKMQNSCKKYFDSYGAKRILLVRAMVKWENQFQNIFYPLGLFGFAESHDFKRQADIAANAAPRVKACGLKHIAMAARLARGAWRHAIDGDVAASRLFEIRHYPQKRGFAAA